MAVAGVPLVLENIISAILESYSVRNWNLFNEKSGDITLRIRFQSEGEGQCPIQDMSYRKKSTKQVERDRSRAAIRQRQVSFENKQSSPERETIRENCEESPEYANYEYGKESILDTCVSKDLDDDSIIHSLNLDEQKNHQSDSFSDECFVENQVERRVVCDSGYSAATASCFVEETEEDSVLIEDKNEERCAKRMYTFYRCFQYLPVAKNFGHFYTCLAEYLEKNNGKFEPSKDFHVN